MRRQKRRVAIVTGTRAEYGLLASTLEAMKKSGCLDYQLVATGMHVLRRFGYTLNQIKSDGWRVDAVVRMQKGDDSDLDHAQGLAAGVKKIAEHLVRSQCDVVLVLGDRIEALAGALAGATTGRFVAHIHGGDIAEGDFDDATRHAITKLSHIHLVATRDAAKRIRRMGEPANRIHVVGAPGLDRLRTMINEETIESDSRHVLIVQHARGRSPATERSLMKSILGAVRSCAMRATVVFPNTDRGHTGVIAAIEQEKKKRDSTWLRVAQSLPRDAFLRELIRSRLLIGNSSSGIIEAATAGTAVVNIGPRQRGRLRAGRCIADAQENARSIRSALKRALRMRPRRGAKTVYGDGRAGESIVRVLDRAELSDAFRRKLNSY